MIAMPHLLFLTLLAVGALLIWALDLAGLDTPTAVAGAVVMGAGAGLLIGAWT